MFKALERHHTKMKEFLSTWHEDQQQIIHAIMQAQEGDGRPKLQSALQQSDVEPPSPGYTSVTLFQIEEEKEEKETFTRGSPALSGFRGSVCSVVSEVLGVKTRAEDERDRILRCFDDALGCIASLDAFKDGLEERARLPACDALSRLERFLKLGRSYVDPSDQRHSTPSDQPDPTPEQPPETPFTAEDDGVKIVDSQYQVVIQHHLDNSRGRTLRLGSSDQEVLYDKKINAWIRSAKFDYLCGVVICLNAISMGISANHSINHLHSPELPLFEYLEIAFLTFYIIEIILRSVALGRDYFFGVDWKWNWFDLILVLKSSISAATQAVFTGMTKNPTSNISFLRLFRLLKMVKLLRVIRLMKIFKELRLILNSVFGCINAMFWAGTLLLIVMYVCGLCFVQAAGSHLRQSAEIDDPESQKILLYYGNVARSMDSLYQASTGGNDWGTIAAPLFEVGKVFYFLFMLYVAFFQLVVLNTVTAIFLDTTLDASAKDDEVRVQAELERKDEYVAMLQGFFNEIDDNGDGTISYQEFCRHVQDPKLHAFATSLEIEIRDAQEFFGIMSHQGAHPVDVHTFVVGCIKLRGQAKSVDLFGLQELVKSNHRTLKQFHQEHREHRAFVEQATIGGIGQSTPALGSRSSFQL